MRVVLIAVGRRPPAWAAAGYAEYSGRMPPELRIELVEITPGRRSRKQPSAAAVREEGARMTAQIPAGAQAVALDERGERWSTRDLATRLARWREAARPLALMIGGPDGLADECRAQAAQTWSLSPLTLPHALARVLVVEQLYRAWTVLTNHPYHRE